MYGRATSHSKLTCVSKKLSSHYCRGQAGFVSKLELCASDLVLIDLVQGRLNYCNGSLHYANLLQEGSDFADDCQLSTPRLPHICDLWLLDTYTGTVPRTCDVSPVRVLRCCTYINARTTS